MNNYKNSSDNTRAIIRINRSTISGNIVWKKAQINPNLSTGERLLGWIYVSEVDKRLLSLYKYETKYFIDEDRFEWVERYRLEMVSPQGKSEWTFLDSDAIEDLYTSVQYKTSNVEDFLNNLLAGEDDAEEDLF